MFPPHLGRLRTALTALASETYSSVSAPIQYAAIPAYSGSLEVERYTSQARRVLSALGTNVANTLRSAGCIVPNPRGGFYLFPDTSTHRTDLAARGIFTSAQLCDRLLAETGIAALPGVDFGQSPDELTMRLAYVDFDGAEALAAAREIPECEPLDDEFIDAHCGSVTRAASILANWLAS